MRDVGLEAEWQVIYGREEFFNATKLMHNALQGNPQDLTEEQWATWTQYNEMNARELARGWDVVRRPRPAARRAALARAREGDRLGLALPHRRLDAEPGDDDAPAAATCSATTRRSSTSPAYVPAGHERRRAHRARRRSTRWRRRTWRSRSRTRRSSARSSASTPSGPLMCQVSRFDPWKDPLGVIDAYRLVKASAPDVQLALVGSMASDDPEGWDFYNATLAHADGDPDIHILNNFNNVGRDRGQRVPVARRRRDPEVDARGLRPDRRRGALEGRARSSAATSAASRSRSQDGETGLPRLVRRGLRRALAARSCATRRSARRSAGAARSTCASTSSRRATCATT